MARSKLHPLAVMVALAFPVSCLVAPTPSDIEVGRMTPPYLSALSPDPLKIWIIPRISATSSGPATFATRYVSFEVVSEDLGRNLQAAIVLDRQGPPNASPGILTGDVYVIPAGHLDDPAPRVVKEMPFTIPPGTEPGCHSLTLIVTHQFQQFRPVPAQASDAAYAVWWLDVDDDVTAPTATLARCSAEYPRQPDAGADGGAP